MKEKIKDRIEELENQLIRLNSNWAKQNVQAEIKGIKFAVEEMEEDNSPETKQDIDKSKSEVRNLVTTDNLDKTLDTNPPVFILDETNGKSENGLMLSQLAFLHNIPYFTNINELNTSLTKEQQESILEDIKSDEYWDRENGR